jgi:hypothetical protein
VFHLQEPFRHWREAGEELVPLTATLKSLEIFVDASLTGRAFVVKDAASGAVVASESQLASEAMNLEKWAANRREMCALTAAARKLAQRLRSFAKLR